MFFARVGVWAAILLSVSVTTTCPPAFPTELEPNVCVFVSGHAETFCQAVNSCKNIGGEILRGEANLQSLIQNGRAVIGPSGVFFVGLTDIPKESYSVLDILEGRKHFRWTDDTPRVSEDNWKAGEPNNGPGGAQHVAVVLLNTNPPSLDDRNPCITNVKFICQPQSSLATQRLYKPVPSIEDYSNYALPACCSRAAPSPPHPFSVRSLLHCATLCNDVKVIPQDGCQTFYYNKVEKKCLLVVNWNTRVDDVAYDDDVNWLRYG